jgi:hypothetical protein
MNTFKTKPCPTCDGEGFTFEYPQITYNLGDKVKKQCPSCHGFGEILFVPPKLRIFTDKEAEPKMEVKFGVTIRKGE